MNSIITRPLGDDFLVENFDELEAIQVQLVIPGNEAVALASVLSMLDERGDLDPMCRNIARTILKRLSEKLCNSFT